MKADEAESGAVTPIQRLGSAANLNIRLHCLMLDGVYRRCADVGPEWDQAFPTNRLLARASLDRLRHNAYCLVLDGQSYRAPKQSPAAVKSVPQKHCKITRGV